VQWAHGVSRLVESIFAVIGEHLLGVVLVNVGQIAPPLRVLVDSSGGTFLWSLGPVV
jgi:hypothetical protein